MKRLVVTAYRTESVLYSADVIVELPSDDTEIDPEQLVSRIWDECVEWEMQDGSDEGSPSFEIERELPDDEEPQLPLIDYEL